MNTQTKEIPLIPVDELSKWVQRRVNTPKGRGVVVGAERRPYCRMEGNWLLVLLDDGGEIPRRYYQVHQVRLEE